jgi:hypothetical protein
MSHQSCSARIRELAQAGSIRDSGRVRKTRSNRNAAVWVAEVPKGLPANPEEIVS